MKCLRIMLGIALMSILFPVSIRAQGGNNCAAALANPVSLPFTLNNFNLCGQGNDVNGPFSCAQSWSGNSYGGQDYMFSVTAPENGFLSINMSDVVAASGWPQPSLTVFQACPLNSADCIAYATGGWGTSPAMVLPASSGETFIILIDALTWNNFYSNCFRFDLAITFVAAPTQPGCTNMGFGANNFSGWIATTGAAQTGPSGAPTPTYNMTGIGEVNSRHAIMTGGNDPVGGFPRVDPNGGPFSVRLGNNSIGAQAEQLRQTFLVSSNNSSFTYRYAVVFEDPGHTSAEQPFFRAIVKDRNGNIVPCSDFVVSARGGLPGFFNARGGSVKYKPWSTVNVDLSNYLGQEVTVEFTAGDCSHGGHYGYAYVDAVCSPSTLSELSDTICPGQSVTLTAPAGYSQYRWNPGNMLSQSITVSPAVSTTYTLSLTAFNGCVSNYSVPLTVAPLPAASFSYTAPACDVPVQLNNTTQVTGGSSYTNSWSFGSNANPSASTQSNPLVTFPAPGTYPVTLVTTSSAGCSGTVTQNVVVPPCKFGVTITGDTVCPGECKTLQYSTAYGFPPYQVNWSTSANTGLQETICPGQTTLVTITLTDATGNVATDTALINLSPGAKFTPIIEHMNCFGLSDGSIRPNVSGWEPFSYLWSTGASTDSLAGLAAGTYSLEVTDIAGCSDTISFLVHQPTPLSATISEIPATCNQANGQVNILAKGGSPPYAFSLDAGLEQTSPQFSGLQSGVYIMQLRDSLNCRFEDSVQINMLSYPTAAQVSVIDATCGLPNGEFRISTITGGLAPFGLIVNGVSYATVEMPFVLDTLNETSLSVVVRDSNNCVFKLDTLLRQHPGPSGLLASITPATCSQNNAALEIDSVISGTAPFRFSSAYSTFSATSRFQNLAPGSLLIGVSDSNGCAYDSLFNITYIPDLQIKANLVKGVSCFGFADGSVETEVLSGSKPFVFKWQNGDLSAIADSLSAGLATVEVTDSNGCIKTAEVQIPQPEKLKIQINGPDYVCKGNTVQLEAIVTGGSRHTNVYWDGFPHSENKLNHQPDSTTTYTASVTDVSGCEADTSHTVLLRLAPKGEIRGENLKGCAPVCAGFWVALSSTEEITSYHWAFHNGETGKKEEEKKCFNETGTHTVAVSITDAFGCKTDLKAENLVEVYPNPLAGFSMQTNRLDEMNPAVMLEQESIGAQFFEWSFGDGEFSFEEEPSHIYADMGNYLICLRVKTLQACADTMCLPLKVDPTPTIYAPSAFTPNGDGKNDHFALVCTHIKTVQLEIFNRWGELIYAGDGVKQGWDGTYQGRPVQADIYVWKALVEDNLKETKRLSGKVALVE